MQLLVDRDAELSELAELLHRASTGDGLQIALIEGQSGVGKSSLVDAFFRQAEQNQNAVAVVGRGSMLTGRSESYLPLRAIAAQLTGIGDESSDSAGDIQPTRRSNSVLQRMQRESLRFIPTNAHDLVGTIIRVPSRAAIQRFDMPVDVQEAWLRVIAHADNTSSSRPTEADSIIRALCSLIAASSRTAPIAIGIDDLQWADPATWEMLPAFRRHLDDLPVILIATVRTDTGFETPNIPWASLRAVLARARPDAQIDLDAVARERASTFCAKLLAASRLPQTSSVVEALSELTGGSPFYASEILRHIGRAQGNASDNDESFVMARIREAPQHLINIVEERLRAIPKTALALLETAAVEGQTFSVGVLSEVHGIRDEDVLDILDRTLRMEHRLVDDVTESSSASGTRPAWRFRFNHGIYREHLYYKMVGPARRTVLHGKIAVALERLYTDTIGDHIAELAIHYSRAFRPDKACGFYALIASRSFELADFETAAESAKEGLRLAEQGNNLSENEESAGQLRTLFQIGVMAARIRGQFDEAGRLAEEALGHPSVCNDLQMRHRLMSELARSLYNRDIDMDRAEELLNRVLTEDIGAERDSLFIADLHRQLGIIKQRLGIYDSALEEYQAALEKAGPEPTPVRADIFDSIGVSLALLGDFKNSVRFAELALSVSSTVRYSGRQTLFLNNMSAALRLLGRYEEFDEVSDRVVRLAKEQGKTGALARALYERGLAKAARHMTEDGMSAARVILEDVIRLEPALLGQGPTFRSARIRAAWLDLGLGNLDRAAERAFALPRTNRESAINGVTEMSVSGLLRAAVLTRRGQFTEARSELAACADGLAALPTIDCWAWPYVRFLVSVGFALSQDPPSELDTELLERARQRCTAPGVWAEAMTIVAGFSSVGLPDLSDPVESIDHVVALPRGIRRIHAGLLECVT